MSYYDPTAVLELQICDRMRDLLEADALVRSVYPAPNAITSIEAETVSAEQDILVSLSPYVLPRQSSTYQTYTASPTYMLCVQKYDDNLATTDREAVMRQLVQVFATISTALLRYPSDPTQFDAAFPARLWDELIFVPNPAPRVNKMPGGFWFICQLFTLNSYQRVP